MKNRVVSSVCFVLLGVNLLSCGGRQKSAAGDGVQVQDSVIAQAMEKDIVSLAPLETGEVFLKDQDPFGEVIELKGQQIVEPDTFIFKTSEDRMLLCSDSILVQKNYRAPYFVFHYPAMTYIKTVGVKGNGPDEFLIPEVVPSVDKEALCCLYERSNGRIYRLDKELNQTYLYTLFPTEKWGVNDLQEIGKNEFVYQSGRYIRTIKVEGDSLKEEKRYPLTLRFARKSPVLGSLAANPQRNRMVYAYKYFKIVKFMNMKGDSVRTLNFQQKGFDDETLNIADGLDANVTHYMQVSPTRDYVYISYSGRTPYAVGSDNDKGNRYMYVEQYDWNGNPVRKYKLDNFSISMMVDGRLNRLMLITYYNDDPYFIYQLKD